ncbi:MAG TPA: glycosyltransferase family 87 protein [Rhizomicrobium sp.]|nr:glycosyltransferase family 87 protein [Rhizomicrobium sp.]
MYPPSFLFLAIGMASLPPLLSFVLWTNATLLLQSAAVAMIVRRWSAAFVAMAAPWAMFCLLLGQDGLLTAAIVGFVLIQLERRQILAGLLLALLSYKPQFGLLFPVALAFGGYWRAFIAAALGVGLLVLASGLAFGFTSWSVFFQALHIAGGQMQAWPGLLSAYGYARRLGLPYEAAIILQTILGASVAVLVAACWRSKISYDLKAASIALCIPLVTPYLWDYDLTLISIALAFMYKSRWFDRIDWIGVAIACLVVAAIPFGIFASFPGNNLPAGLIACAAIGVLLLRRCSPRPSHPKYSPDKSMDFLSPPGRAGTSAPAL